MIQSTQSFEVQGPPEVHNVDAVLRETLDKLLAAAPKRLKELRDECTADLERLKNSATGGVNADEFFKALKLACEATGNAKVISIALDSINKLLSYGFLTGKGADPFKEAAPGTTRCLIDTVIECICSCAEQTDDTVQLQMIRAVLTAVTSNTCEVHGNSLILAVTTCFKIHRDSKSNMNQRTAQGSLTQILTVVVKRMEMSSAHMSRVSVEDPGDSRSRQAAKLASSDLASLPPAKLLQDWTSSYLTRLVDDVVMQQHQKNGGKPPSGSSTEMVPPGKFGWCVVCRGSAAHYCVDTKDPICGHKCKFRNLERQSLVETHFGPHREEDAGSPAVDSAAESERVTAPSADPATCDGTSRTETTVASPLVTDEASSEGFETNDKALNPYHRDALMAFQWLCKLSMKELPAGQADSRLVRQKRMALDLVLVVLQNSGPVFRSSDHCIAVMQKLLCISLVKNSVSSIPKIFSLSLQIFLMLITNFKEHLRTEIGVFIEQIFLRILESGNSTYHHKYRVLQVFYKLCTDASTALELFLNFDCDVDEKNIFERMMDCLSKIAQGKYTSVEHANIIQPHQEQELKILALQALVTLMGSIVDWARRMTEDQRSAQIEDGHVQETRPEAESDGEDDAASEPASAAGSLPGAAAAVNSTIVSQKQRKLDLQVGVNKFNMRPKRGIEYLKHQGFVTDDPKVIAEFFMNQDIGLDKTAVGEFLGEDKPFQKSILYALADMQDFREKDLYDSLRGFLSIFRLPGEAQKIDRMMEKFAEKFCNDNPGKFANADCAFVLSFSMIMLQTDLHNPQVKNKMTKDQFISNNRGINDGQDLPREYLEKLYESISTNPMSLKEDEDMQRRMESQSAQGASQKFELFVKETESIVQKSQEMMKQRISRQKSCAYVTAQSVEHVRPLFEVACWPYLATLAVLLEMQDSPTSVELCIEGFKHCIRIAARFDMDTERDAFVSSLAKFTYLITIKEMKQKNIECIKALFAIGLSEGNNLGPAWQYVLHCISQLERLHLIGSRSREDFQFFQGEEEGPSGSPALARSTSVSAGGNQVFKRRAHGLGVSALVSLGSEDRQVELVNSESVIAQIDVAQIELLFNRSTSLGSTAIVHFVTQLARVSVEELALADQPRIFSLQKLVEVADYNMGRIRLVWSRIWRVLSKHFVEVAKHSNKNICMYGIDSLRQLAMKFLEKDELSNYNFQAEFLRPFEVVISTPGVSREVKDLVVSIISNMVHSRINNIKSGWKTVFHILHSAAQEHSSEIIAQSAFACIEKVIEVSYHLFIENLTDGVRCLLAFGQCKANLSISLKAIAYLLQAAEYLADNTKPGPPPPPVSSLVGVGGGAAEAVAEAGPSHPAAHWFPILRGLSMLVSDPRRDVRASALNGVFDCLRDHGSAVFDEDTWRMVFNGVIKPLFYDIHDQLQNGDQRRPDGAADGRSEGTAASWAASMGPPTCLAALTALVRLFGSNLASLAFLLDDVLRLIEKCIQHDTEAVARIGVEGFKQLLIQTGKNLDAESWQKVTSSILKLFNDSMPTELMCVEVNAAGDGQLPFRKEAVVNQCVVQLLLIDMLQDAVDQHYEYISTAGIATLLDALQRSFEFAQEFNQQIELRQTLKRLGFMREMRQLPGLLKQEREALSCSLKVLFRIQGDVRMHGSEHADQAVKRLMHLSTSVLRNYVSKEQHLQELTDARHAQDQQPADAPAKDRDVEMEREISGLERIISEVLLRGLKDLHAGQFARHAQELFPLLSELTVVNSREIRVMVRDVLLERVGPLLGQEPRPPADAQAAGAAGGGPCAVEAAAAGEGEPEGWAAG